MAMSDVNAFGTQVVITILPEVSQSISYTYVACRWRTIGCHFAHFVLDSVACFDQSVLMKRRPNAFCRQDALPVLPLEYSPHPQIAIGI